MINKILLNRVTTFVLLNFCVYSQDCDSGFTYIEELPDNITNINNENNCFYETDLAVLSAVYDLNELVEYDSYLYLGLQTWVTGRLVNWVATYIPSGQNGLTERIDQLPDNFGDLDGLAGLYIEKHNIINLPNSFSNLTNLVTLAISNNQLISLPDDIGNLISLMTLDLGYNNLESIPESIGGLVSLEYLFLFNNELSSLPETICDLNLDWDGISPQNYPYFASGGNYLCDSELIPDCVENSANFNISMEQNYYSFLLDDPQFCPESCGASVGDVNGDESYNVLDIVTLANCVLGENCPDWDYGCAGDMNDDGFYNVLDIVTLANCVLAENCDN